jgi:hypothetical protein
MTLSPFAPDEGGGVWQQKLLALRGHREEVADHGSGAVGRSASARPRIAVEGVQPVVDRDLLTGGDRSPREHLHTMAHGIRVAAMVQEATRGLEDREAIERQLAEMDAFPFRDRAELGGGDNTGMSSPKDELALLEVAPREDALALRSRVANLYIAEHGVTVLR